MKLPFFILTGLALAGCAVPTTGIIPRSEGMYTVTRQGGSAWVQPFALTADGQLDIEVTLDLLA